LLADSGEIRLKRLSLLAILVLCVRPAATLASPWGTQELK